ncbi:hypothetical protein TNCV_865161 [Trichonephila clavipes]|nr:hypothetical protein TNCV_865161 [Trichonephila clavipes]
MIRQQFRFKFRTHDNVYRDGKVRGETRPLDFKVFDPSWTKKGVIRKLRKSEIEFQKRCFKRRVKPKATIRGDKASPRLYWDRGKRSSRDIIIMWRGHRREKREGGQHDGERQQLGGMGEKVNNMVEGDRKWRKGRWTVILLI